MLSTARVCSLVQLGVDVLEYGELVFLVRLVQCYLPGDHRQFWGAGFALCNEVEGANVVRLDTYH